MQNPMTTLAAENALAVSERSGEHIAIVPIHFDLLAKMLGFPEGTVIEGVFQVPEKPHMLQIRVIHPELRFIHEGDVIEHVSPTYAKTDEAGSPRYVFVKWGDK